jgi:hypothetical protein
LHGDNGSDKGKGLNDGFNPAQNAVASLRRATPLGLGHGGETRQESEFPFSTKFQTSLHNTFCEISMLIIEYRIPLPFTLEEWQKGQQYMIAKASLLETDGREGIEVLKDEPFQNDVGKGNFTHKVFHLASKLPEWTKKIIPDSVLQIEEKSWNLFPYSKTVYRCPLFGDRCKIIVETIHKADNGDTYNIHKLNRQILKERIVDLIDIAEDTVDKKFYKPEEDPTLFESKKTKRGPLTYGWRFNTKPIICAYKLAIVEFNVPGFRKRGEKLIHDIIRGIYLRTHRQAFCWIDEWIDISLNDIKKMEEKLTKRLKASRKQQLNVLRTGQKIDTQKTDSSASKSNDSEDNDDKNDLRDNDNIKSDSEEDDESSDNSKERETPTTKFLRHDKQKDAVSLPKEKGRSTKQTKRVERNNNSPHSKARSSNLFSKMRTTLIRSKL